MSTENSESMTPLLMLGVFEAAINNVLAQNAQAIQTIALNAGKVIRVKIYNPQYSLYLVLCEEGIQILSRFDGVVDARIKAPASQLVWLMLGESMDSQSILTQLKITGNRQLIADLIQLAVEINLWHWIISVLQEWLPNYREVIQHWTVSRTQPDDWMEGIQHLSQLASDTLDEIRRQSHSQQAVLTELVKIRQRMEKKQASHSIQWLLGLVFVVIIWFMAMK